MSETILDAVLAPAVGRIEGKKENRVTWTGEEPASMIAVWNDDDPDRVELKPKPAPQQTGTG